MLHVSGEKVRRYRIKKILKQKELAERAGVNVDTVGNVELGKHQPSINTLRKLAQALEVDPHQLMKEENGEA